MNIYIVEDDKFHLEDIKITIEELQYTCIGYANNPFDALEGIDKKKPDVVLIDIHLNGKQDGIALAKRIKKLLNIPIIFTSSETKNTIINEAAEVNPISYIAKPVSKNSLNAALVLAKNKIRNKQIVKDSKSESEVFIKHNGKLIKVSFVNILFAHTDTKNYCTIVTIDNKRFTVRNSVLGLSKFLNHDIFIQTHRSYIVNWKKVDSISETDQTLNVLEYTIPIGRSFKEDVYKRLKVL